MSIQNVTRMPQASNRQISTIIHSELKKKEILSGRSGTLQTKKHNKVQSNFYRNIVTSEIFVICRLKLVRDCLVINLIQSGLAASVQGYSCVDNWAPNSRDVPTVIAVFEGDGQEVTGRISADVKAILKKAPKAKVLVISELYEPGTIIAAYYSGAKAFLGSDVSLNLLTAVIRLVQAGELYYPAKILIQIRERRVQSRIEFSKIKLSTRQHEIALLLLEGVTDSEMSNALGIAESSVRAYISRLILKIGAHSRAEAVGLLQTLESK